MNDQLDFLADPIWLPHRYDAPRDQVQFVKMDRAARERLTFLADYQPELGCEAQWVAGEKIRGVRIEPRRGSFIFHSAFARSTLLVRCFNQLESSVGLSEPAILNDLSVAFTSSVAAAATIVPTIDLLARPHGGAQSQTVIKPSNVANILIDEILSKRPLCRAILLTADLEDFLISIAKKGLMGRRWVRRLYLRLASYTPLDLGLSPEEIFELTDLQVAGLSWLQHQQHFGTLLRRHPKEQLVTLRSKEIEGDPLITIYAVANHFGINCPIAELEAIVAGPLFARHAKLGSDYASTVAREASDTLSPTVQKEISMAAKWVLEVASYLRINIPVSRPIQARSIVV